MRRRFNTLFVIKKGKRIIAVVGDSAGNDLLHLWAVKETGRGTGTIEAAKHGIRMVVNVKRTILMVVG